MKKILVCTDGSNYARVCCEYAAWLAGRTGASIQVLYVTDLRQFEVPLVADLSGSLGLQPYQAVMGQLQELERKKADVVLEDARRILVQNGVDQALVEVSHQTGLLVDSLEDSEEDADLVMLGKRGENANFAKAHIGSTVERVVRASSKPCLVTSRSFKPLERLLLAYDAGKSCEKALRFLSQSNALKGLELHIVAVSENAEEDFFLQGLQQAEEMTRGVGFAPICQMLHGDVEDAISEYVVKQKIDLLLMGAYGHSRIRRFLIGSTTTEMIRRCQIPVLLFR